MNIFKEMLYRNNIATLVFPPFLLTSAVSIAGDEQPPQLGDACQADIDAARALAANGEDPSSACAGVKGAAMHRAKAGDPMQGQLESAARAVRPCSVEIPARYILNGLDQVRVETILCAIYFSDRARANAAMIFSLEDTGVEENQPAPEQALRNTLKEAELEARPKEALFFPVMEE